MKKVLILGAGSSKAYGFPLWEELEPLVVAKLEELASGEDSHLIPDLELEPAQLQEAITTIKSIPGDKSVDLVVEETLQGGFAEFEVLFRRVTSKVLAGLESADSESTVNDWIEYLVGKFAPVVIRKLEDPKAAFDRIDIVSFNYERCFSHRFFPALIRQVRDHFGEVEWERTQSAAPYQLQPRTVFPHASIGSLLGEGLPKLESYSYHNVNKQVRVSYGDSGLIKQRVSSGH